MDYKEKYEQALEVAKETYNKQPMYKDWLESMFPELSESEDERIRKALIKMVHDTTGDELWVDYNIHKEEAIAWLEKQGEEKKPYGQRTECFDCQFNYAGECKGSCAMKRGEQKPVVIIPKFRIGDNIKTTNEEPLTITKIDGKGYWSEDLFICGFDDAAKWELVEQKPAWSEEDEEELFNVVYACLNFYGKDSDTTDWLKSLKQRIGG